MNRRYEEPPKGYPKHKQTLRKLKNIVEFATLGVLIYTVFTLSNTNKNLVQTLETLSAAKDIPDVVETQTPQEEAEIEKSMLSLTYEREYFSSCNIESTFKSYMDYRRITNTESKQYKLQKDAYTEDGVRKVEGRVMIAVANFNVGDKLNIEFTTGEILEAIVGDIKANTNCTHPDGSMIEFIVDSDTMDKRVKLLGSFHEVYPGGVVGIERLTIVNE